VLKPNEVATYSFQLKAADAPGTVSIFYGGMAVAHHEHSDPNAEDFGNFTKWSTLTFDVGENHVVGTASLLVGVRDPGPLMRSWAQVLGFAGAILLVPALVFGGTFGPKSVNAFNRLLGPRRRVLWHNSTSFALLAVALIHMTVFLIEQFWTWTHGMLWGGLAIAAMIGLGVSGATQKRFVARWGFERWRFVHFALGIMTVAFVILHMLLDGSHLAPVREAVADQM
jgi:hypothetical protein